MSEKEAGSQSVTDYILHHVQDSDKWHPFGHWIEVKFSKFLPESIFGLEIKNGLHLLMILLAPLFLFILFKFVYRNKRSWKDVPSGFAGLLEVLVDFVRKDIAIEYLGEKDGKKFTPLFLNFFFFILLLNLMGLVPALSTATANINITFALAIITFFVMIFGGIKRNGLGGFISSLIPSGIPTWTIPILFPVEVLGLFVKPFALMIRLFANLLAGHLVIFFILALIPIIGEKFGTSGAFFASPAIFLGLFIFMMEIFIALLQAYIFTMLSAMFIGSMLHPDH